MAYNKEFLYAIIVGILAIIVAVIVVKPSQWIEILRSWALFINNYSVIIILLILIGSVIGIYLFYNSKRCVELLPYDAEHFSSTFQKIKNKNPKEIRIFGYTSETLSDYIKYDDRYKNLNIKILLRNWINKKKDEEEYNSTLGKDSSRPWKKWENLKIKANEWKNAGDTKVNYKIELKFYSEVPIFKGIIVIYQNNEIEVFLGLYEWKKIPKEGGSQFKGDKGAVVHLCSKSSSELEKILLLRTVSQFDRMWEKGISYEKVESP